MKLKSPMAHKLYFNPMRYITADIIYPISSAPIPNGLITIDDGGTIVAISPDLSNLKSQTSNLEHYEGSIVPGFINAHCHLELSHLKGCVAEHTGLVDFVLAVQQFRNVPLAEVEAAMQSAEAEMLENGIVAVGDISNTANSFTIKAKSNIYYHTFIELLGFNPEKASEILAKGEELLSTHNASRTTHNAQRIPHNASLTPHAPYSVSPALFQAIDEQENLISIHNQECPSEDHFYQEKKGDFNRLYETFGLDISYFTPTEKSSLQSYLPYLPKSNTIQFVHNTCSSATDIAFAKASGKELYWCLCPNANLYIENRLPEIPQFLGADDYITIGTDSLSSNHQLNILGELKTIQKHFPEITTETLLKWATLNGARFLGIDKQYGTLEVGKKPGLVQLTGLKNGVLNQESKSKRIA